MSNTTVTLEAKPLGQLRFLELERFRGYNVTSADGTCLVHMQTERISTNKDDQGIWYGNEIRTDQHGATWTRSIRNMVQDDFGMLVEVSR